MGVCCIVFDIDGMLFEFFMNFLNIEFFFFFQYFMFSSRFMLFPTLKKKIGVKKNLGCWFFIFLFLFKNSFSFHILCYFQNIKKCIEKCPFTYWLNGRWFLQIVDRDSWNLYPLYPLFPCSDFVSQMWGWFGGGGGGCNVFLIFYAISNIYRKKNLGIQNNYFSFNVFFMFFFVCWKYWKVPFTYSYWLNGRWFLQIVDIGNFIMRLEILKSAPSLTG